MNKQLNKNIKFGSLRLHATNDNKNQQDFASNKKPIIILQDRIKMNKEIPEDFI